MKATAKAQLRSLRVGPRKVRLLVDLIRGMNVDDALVQLSFSKKSAAVPLKKLLESAIANAKEQSMKREGLVIETAYVDEGRTLKRWMPRAMGRATPIRKRSSHVTLILAGEVDAVAATKKQAEADKKTDEKVAEATETEVKETKAKKAPAAEKKEAKKTTKKNITKKEDKKESK